MKKIPSLVLLLLSILLLTATCDSGGTPEPSDGQNGSTPTNNTENRLTFDANGGTVSLEPELYEEGEYLYIEFSKETIFRDGYIFGGWNDAPDGSGSIKVPRSGDFTPQTSGPLTLYAQWHKEYALGATGPGGGTIFYDFIKARSEPFGGYIDWLYLEVSPKVMETGGPWGLDHGEKYVGGTKADIGSGLENTDRIIERLDDWNDHDYAAYRARYPGVPNEYDDWFLPSRLELGRLHHYAHNHDPDNALELILSSSVFYWSSEEGYEGSGQHSTGNAFVYTFATESSEAQFNSHAKGNGNHVRPIRMF